MQRLLLCLLFASPAVAGEDSPWLSQEDHNYIRGLWPEGVPIPVTLGFYKLPRASQQLATTNGRPSRGFHSNSGINLEFPYRGSGGMDWAEQGTWRNVTGLSIPKGQRIAVWAQRKPVLNSFGSYQQEEALFWRFPKGTQAFDVLLKKNKDGSEHIFSVRVRSKDEKWDDGVSYFPDVHDKGEMQAWETPGNSRTKNVLGVANIIYKVAQVRPLALKRYQFTESKTALADGGTFFPPGFKGTGLSCNKCHIAGQKNESSPYAGPELRGRDTIFSWYPVKVESVDRDYYTPEIDRRWPVQVEDGR